MSQYLPRNRSEFIKIERGKYWEPGANPLERGRAVQRDLAETDYRDYTNTDDPNFTVYDPATDEFKPAAAQNFPLIDFYDDTTAISVKSVDTRGSASWVSSLKNHIDDLETRSMKINGVDVPKSNRIIDIRVQPGGLNDVDRLLSDYADDAGIQIVIREHP